MFSGISSRIKSNAWSVKFYLTHLSDGLNLTAFGNLVKIEHFHGGHVGDTRQLKPFAY